MMRMISPRHRQSARKPFHRQSAAVLHRKRSQVLEMVEILRGESPHSYQSSTRTGNEYVLIFMFGTGMRLMWTENDQFRITTPYICISRRDIPRHCFTSTFLQSQKTKIQKKIIKEMVLLRCSAWLASLCCRKRRVLENQWIVHGQVKSTCAIERWSDVCEKLD